MSDKNMIVLAEIRNGYALNKYGNLTLEQNSLIKYDNLCLNLIKENQELKKDIKNIIRILNKNCDELETTEEEFESLEKWSK